MPLYRIISDKAVLQIKQTGYPKERDLQNLFESNLEDLLGVRYVASEVTTGDRQRGRIDSLGLDQDNYPTIIEYKRSNRENIINQGLFYLDWLVDHKGDFTMAAQKSLGSDIKIDWSRPRLILVAEFFSEYDKYAVNRIGANIELWTFRKYGEDLLYLDPLFVASPQPTKGTPFLTTKESEKSTSSEYKKEPEVYTIEFHTNKKSQNIIDMFEQLRERILNMAEEGEITEKPTKVYIAYKHGKNFCEVSILSKFIRLWLDVPAGELDDPFHLIRDVTHIGHHGTGNSAIDISDFSDLDNVMSLVEQSFRQSI